MRSANTRVINISNKAPHHRRNQPIHYICDPLPAEISECNYNLAHSPHPSNTTTAAAAELQYLLATWKQMSQVQEITKQLTFILFFLEFLLTSCGASLTLRLHLQGGCVCF